MADPARIMVRTIATIISTGLVGCAGAYGSGFNDSDGIGVLVGNSEDGRVDGDFSVNVAKDEERRVEGLMCIVGKELGLRVEVTGAAVNGVGVVITATELGLIGVLVVVATGREISVVGVGSMAVVLRARALTMIRR